MYAIFLALKNISISYELYQTWINLSDIIIGLFNTVGLTLMNSNNSFKDTVLTSTFCS